jgi:CubicO group peptidase (beta-lactamase class C family)
MSASRLQDMLDFITENSLDVHSVTVIRHGYVLLNETPFPFQGQSRTQSYNGTHYLYSATKSFTSCLIGIAIKMGYIDNISQAVLSFFPDMTFANVDDRKERMTLEDLLTMRSGLPWDETSAPFSSPENDVFQVSFNSSGGVQFVLDRPMEHEPGEVFLYNSGATHVLSGVIQEVTGMTTAEFAEQYLFDPLGIDVYYWPSDTKGVTFGAWDLQLRPLDMVKLGYLFLNNGTWDGEQIVTESWVNESVQTVSTLSPTHGYGFQWHTAPQLNSYFAAGLYGQYIFVCPELDIVAGFTSGYGLSDIDYNPHIFGEYILDAVLGAPGEDLVTLLLVVGLPAVAIVLVGAYFWSQRRTP